MRNGIDVRLRHEVVAIDLDARTVTVVDRDTRGTERVEAFDQLVIATGATPIRPRPPGHRRRGIHGMQTIDDGIDAARRPTCIEHDAGGRGRRRLHRARDGRGAAQARA